MGAKSARGGRNQRSQSRSRDRRVEKDKRSEAGAKSPRSSRERIQKVDKEGKKSDTEDDSEEERKDLERRLKKLEDKKRSKTNRIKRNVFGNEDDYINLERELYSRRNSRDRSVRIVRENPREISEPPCSPLTQRAAGISSRQSSESEGHRKISPIITNQEEDCDLEKGEENVEPSVGEKTEFGEFRETKSGQMEYVDWKESEMVGEGDFRGMHQRDPNSRYNALLRRIKKQNRDPTLKGKFLNKCRGKYYNFCCDTGSSCNLIPARMAALNGLEYTPLDDNEPNYSSVTNHRLNILGQTTCFIRLEKISKPIKISFLVCGDDGDEALLSLDTLVELSIVPPDFPCPTYKE